MYVPNISFVRIKKHEYYSRHQSLRNFKIWLVSYVRLILLWFLLGKIGVSPKRWVRGFDYAWEKCYAPYDINLTFQMFTFMFVQSCILDIGNGDKCPNVVMHIIKNNASKLTSLILLTSLFRLFIILVIF